MGGQSRNRQRAFDAAPGGLWTRADRTRSRAGRTVEADSGQRHARAGAAAKVTRGVSTMPTDTIAELERLAVAVANSPLCQLKVETVFRTDRWLHGEVEPLPLVLRSPLRRTM